MQASPVPTYRHRGDGQGSGQVYSFLWTEKQCPGILHTMLFISCGTCPTPCVSMVHPGLSSQPKSCGSMLTCMFSFSQVSGSLLLLMELLAVNYESLSWVNKLTSQIKSLPIIISENSKNVHCVPLFSIFKKYMAFVNNMPLVLVVLLFLKCLATCFLSLFCFLFVVFVFVIPDHFGISWGKHSQAWTIRHEGRGVHLPPQPPVAWCPRFNWLGYLSNSKCLSFHLVFLSQYFIYSCILGLISCSVFLRVNYELKMLIMMVALVGYNTVLLHTHAHILDAYSQVLFHRWVDTHCLCFSLALSWQFWSYGRWKLSELLPSAVAVREFLWKEVQEGEMCFRYWWHGLPIEKCVWRTCRTLKAGFV